MISVNDIKKFHQEYNRLTLLDHVILLVVSTYQTVTLDNIYMGVFRRYRQVTKSELKPLIRKLAKLDLIRYEYYLGGYILTKTGIEELEFVKDFIDHKKIEGEVYSSS